MASNVVPFPRRGANDNNNPVPPQPGLRAFIVYDQLPEGCIAFEVEDDCAQPHLRAGDFVIVDTMDTEPMHGEMFLIQWSKGRQVVETRLRAGRFGTGPGGEFEDTSLWFAEWQMTMTSLSGVPCRPMRWGDGPWREEHFREKLVGRVVGFYQPDFRHQLRIAA